MLRIVDGVAFVGKESPDRWQLSVLNLGNGHVEASARRCIDWQQAEWDVEKARRDLIDKLGEAAYLKRCEQDEADRQAANLQRAARRAKTRVRRLCKAQGLDTLLTLTYRANVADLEVVRAHLAAFVRRMRAALGQFAYVACFEKQKRGAWHVHLAVHRLPATMAAANGVKVKSFNVVRAIWRRVTGELGGNVDVSRRKATAHKSAARVAGYLSKYMLKAFEELEAGANRYSASMGVQIPRAVSVQIRAEHFADVIALLHVDCAAADLRLVSAWVSQFGDACFLAAESALSGRRGCS